LHCINCVTALFTNTGTDVTSMQPIGGDTRHPKTASSL